MSECERKRNDRGKLEFQRNLQNQSFQRACFILHDIKYLLNTAPDDQGGFQLEILSITLVINRMTCYKFECSHWLKLQHSDWRATLVRGHFFIT